MKKLFLTLISLAALLHADQLEMTINDNQAQWQKDLNMLISLSDKKIAMQKTDDQNKNLVRDDVEQYILSKYAHDRFQKEMFLEAAVKIQEIISLPLSGKNAEHEKLDKELLALYTCRDYIILKNEKPNIDEELLNKTLFKGKVLNTPERLKAYIEHKKLLPFNFSELTKEAMEQDKKSCIARYNSYLDEDKQSASLPMEKNKGAF